MLETPSLWPFVSGRRVTLTQIDRLDAGLRSIQGAREVISMICDRRSVTKLILGNNHLGDHGCCELFDFLTSDQGRKYKIAEISLNGNGIGDRGLKSIAEYIAGNVHLKELFLQSNAFKGNRDVVSAFTLALNTSHITTLSLSTNFELSDPFAAVFLSRLSAPHLHTLQLSAINLTSISVTGIISFVSSHCSRTLRCLLLSGNSLGGQGVHAILDALDEKNFSLFDVAIYANITPSPPSDTHGMEREEETFDWKESEAKLRRITERNKTLRREVEKSALSLLPCTRAILLPHAREPPILPSPPISPNPRVIARPRASFDLLPAELKMHILTCLAPVLSNAQLLRIYKYASSFDTLPTVLPRHSCLPDPSGLPSVMGGGGCSDGHCMGAGNNSLCHREENRGKYLTAVDCRAFDADRTTNARIACLFSI